MVNENEFEEFVFKIALENAITYNGKANSKALIGKIIPKFPEIKKDMNYYMNKIENIVKQVNDFEIEVQKKKIKELNPNFFKKLEEKRNSKKKKKGEFQLPELKNITNKIRVRFEPSPSGHLHFGHLFGIIFNLEYARKYDGKFILRFGDTNPGTSEKDAYENIIDILKWITENKIDEIYYQSKRMDIYYKYLAQLIQTNYAYVCECDNEKFTELITAQKECPHRNRSPEENLELLNKMCKGEIEPGKAVIRFKAGLENKNPALRDFSIARISTDEHPLVGKKYTLWPMMNLAVPIDDYEMRISHVIRGKDHEINMIRQKMILSALGLKSPEYIHFGRVKFVDIELSKRKILEKIRNKEYEGWDDPRLPTIESLRRKGYVPKGIRKTILSMGLTKRDSKITQEDFFKKLNYYNKQELEPVANRFFFVSNPRTIKIKGIEKYPEKEIKLPLHPDKKERGYRTIKITEEYYIDRIDFNNLEKGDFIRLMHFANFKITDKTEQTLKLEYYSKEYDPKLNIKRNIHYVPTKKEQHRETIIIMPNNEKIKGFTELLYNPKKGTPLQFERFGFVRFDSIDKEKRRIFYFTHS